jgi:hypothetical protein
MQEQRKHGNREMQILRKKQRDSFKRLKTLQQKLKDL